MPSTITDRLNATFDLTQREIEAGATPTSYDFAPGDCRRFGVSTAASATANTAAFNTALSVGGLVFLDLPGTYVVNGNLHVRSNTLFRIGPRVIVQGAASKAWLDTGIVDITGRSKVALELDGTIDGNKANNATGRAFGIRIHSSTDVSVLGSGSVINCPGTSAAGTVGGDGIYVGGAGTARVTIGAVLCDSNVRQGVSLVRGTDITLIGTRCTNTTGNNPGGGVDVEADTPGTLKRIRLIGLHLEGNHRNLQIADAEEVTVVGAICRNARWNDVVVVRATDLNLQATINSHPSIVQSGVVYCEASENCVFDVEITGNNDPQQRSGLRISEGCRNIRARIKGQEIYGSAVSIGASKMGRNITDIFIEDCHFIDCTDSSQRVGVIFIDGNRGSGFHPRRITIRNNTIYDSRTGGSQALSGIQVSTNIPAATVAEYRLGENSISGPTVEVSMGH